MSEHTKTYACTGCGYSFDLLDKGGLVKKVLIDCPNCPGETTAEWVSIHD